MPKKPRKPEKFVRTPGYPGGRKALGEFIISHLKYPAEAASQNIQGNVTVQFILNESGKVVEAAVLQGLGYGCDEEALRLVKSLQFKGVNNRGVRATFKKTLKIPFKFKKKSASPNINITYTFKETKESSSSKFNYTIKKGKSDIN